MITNTKKGLGGISITGRAREDLDYYATHPEALSLLEYEDFENVWECACGEGHLAKELDNRGKLGKASDIYDRGYGEVEDFLYFNKQWSGDILTNPPFMFFIEFVIQGMNTLLEGNKLALLVPQRYLSGQTRRKIFLRYPPYKIYPFTKRIRCGKNGEFTKSNLVDYMWVIWKQGYIEQTIIDWSL